MQSDRFSLNWDDVKSWSITTGLLILAAAVTIVTDEVADLNLGPVWEPVVIAVLASFLKLVQKLLRGPSPDGPDTPNNPPDQNPL